MGGWRNKRELVGDGGENQCRRLCQRLDEVIWSVKTMSRPTYGNKRSAGGEREMDGKGRRDREITQCNISTKKGHNDCKEKNLSLNKVSCHYLLRDGNNQG